MRPSSRLRACPNRSKRRDVAFVPGMKVRYVLQPEWGVGHLVRTLEGGSVAEVLFPGRSQPTLVSTRGNSLVAHQLGPGDPVRTAKGRPATITGEEPGGRGLRRYVLRYEDGTEDEMPESEVQAPVPDTDLLSTLQEGRVADARAFLLRRQALTLDEERRNDALGALLASRVMVKPHQVGVVQRVLSARRPRFVLADEVGLGKTIEAGMVFSALRLSGLAARVLVIAPEPPDRAVARRAVPQVPAALHPGRRRATGPEPPRRSGHLALGRRSPAWSPASSSSPARPRRSPRPRPRAGTWSSSTRRTTSGARRPSPPSRRSPRAPGASCCSPPRRCSSTRTSTARCSRCSTR